MEERLRMQSKRLGLWLLFGRSLEVRGSEKEFQRRGSLFSGFRLASKRESQPRDRRQISCWPGSRIHRGYPSPLISRTPKCDSQHKQARQDRLPQLPCPERARPVRRRIGCLSRLDKTSSIAVAGVIFEQYPPPCIHTNIHGTAVAVVEEAQRSFMRSCS